MAEGQLPVMFGIALVGRGMSADQPVAATKCKVLRDRVARHQTGSTGPMAPAMTRNWSFSKGRHPVNMQPKEAS
jgi:hypothetical protein